MAYDPNMARFALIMVNIWLGFPYMMNICIGAINAIPTEYYEAADADGASKLVQFLRFFTFNSSNSMAINNFIICF